MRSSHIATGLKEMRECLENSFIHALNHLLLHHFSVWMHSHCSKTNYVRTNYKQAQQCKEKSVWWCDASIFLLLLLVCLCCYLKSNDPYQCCCKVTATNAIQWDYSAYIDPILRLQFICISGWWSFWIELGDFKYMHTQTLMSSVSITKCITIVLDHTERMRSDFKWYFKRVAILGETIQCAALAQFQPSTYCLAYNQQKYFWALLRVNFHEHKHSSQVIAIRVKWAILIPFLRISFLEKLERKLKDKEDLRCEHIIIWL